MSTDARAVSAAYFEAWLGKDFDRLRTLLADDATFEGPLASLDNADDCVKGLQGMSEIVTDIVIEKVLVDGDDVFTWFALHNSVAPAAQTVNWQKIVDGKIVAIRVLFDPREIIAAG